MKKTIVVLTGAGISAESGIKTFRDSDGLWENYDINEIATPEGWRKNPALVLQFYNERRRQLLAVLPNEGHKALVTLEEKYNVHIITQNVDDLHERAGSSQVMHLHGELRSKCSSRNKNLRFPCDTDILLGELAPDKAQMRPDIVWFGEDVPMIYPAADLVETADYILVIGSSMQVYPAAGLVSYATPSTPIWYIDPNPALNYELHQSHNLKVIEAKASIGVPQVVKNLLDLS
jgi:NAD-dependent deacetylase